MDQGSEFQDESMWPRSEIIGPAPSVASIETEDGKERLTNGGKSTFSCHPKHRMDLFVPDGSIQPFPRPLRPVVLFVHGGAWMQGDKQHRGNTYSNVGISCARAGFIGAVTNYRLSPEVTVWDQMRDIAAAVGYIRQHAKTFGGNPDKIVLMGHSAGAHLITLLASQPRWLKDAIGAQHEVDDFIKGLVCVSGVYNISRLASTPLGPRLIHPTFGEDPHLWRLASPTHNVHQNSALQTLPMLLINASDDLHLEQDTEEFLQRMISTNKHGASIQSLERIQTDLPSKENGEGAVLSWADINGWMPERPLTYAMELIQHAAGMYSQENAGSGLELPTDHNPISGDKKPDNNLTDEQLEILQYMPVENIYWWKAVLNNYNHVTIVSNIGQQDDACTELIRKFLHEKILYASQ